MDEFAPLQNNGKKTLTSNRIEQHVIMKHCVTHHQQIHISSYRWIKREQYAAKSCWTGTNASVNDNATNGPKTNRQTIFK